MLRCRRFLPGGLGYLLQLVFKLGYLILIVLSLRFEVLILNLELSDFDFEVFQSVTIPELLENQVSLSLRQLGHDRLQHHERLVRRFQILQKIRQLTHRRSVFRAILLLREIGLIQEFEVVILKILHLAALVDLAETWRCLAFKNRPLITSFLGFEFSPELSLEVVRNLLFLGH